MAEKEPGFIFGGNTGVTEEGVRNRRAIAAALAAKRMRAPKTVGEGMTYFGESLNEALGSYMLNQQEQILAARAAEQMRQLGIEPPITPSTPPPPVRPPAPTVPPGGARPSAAPAFRPPPMATTAASLDVGNAELPEQIAEAVESGETVFDDQGGNQGAVPPVGTEPPPDQGAVSPVQLASLPDVGATVSDAPPVGAEPTLPPNPPIISDIQPYQVAQAGGGPVSGPTPGPAPSFPPGVPSLYGPRPAAPTAPSNLPPGIPPGMTRPPELPAPPPALPLTEKERRGFQASQYGATESVRAAGARLQAIGAQERAIEEKRQHEEWSKDYATKEAIRKTWSEFMMPKPQQEFRVSTEAEERAKRIQNKFGDQGIEPYAKAADESYKVARTIPATVATLDQASDLVDRMTVGGGATTRNILEKLGGFVGVPVGPNVHNSEIFQALMTRIYGPIRADVVGTGGQNTAEGRTLENAVAGNINLEPGTIKEVISSLRKVNEHLAAEHHKNLAVLSAGDMREATNIYARQGLDMVPIVPIDDVRRLREMITADPSKSREVAKQFDEAWHTPGLAEKVWNSRRGR